MLFVSLILSLAFPSGRDNLFVRLWVAFKSFYVASGANDCNNLVVRKRNLFLIQVYQRTRVIITRGQSPKGSKPYIFLEVITEQSMHSMHPIDLSCISSLNCPRSSLGCSTTSYSCFEHLQALKFVAIPHS